MMLHHLAQLEAKRRRRSVVWTSVATVANLIGWTLWVLDGPWWPVLFHTVVTVVLAWLWYVVIREWRDLDRLFRRAADLDQGVPVVAAWVCPHCGDHFTNEDEDTPPTCDLCRKAGRT